MSTVTGVGTASGRVPSAARVRKMVTEMGEHFLTPPAPPMPATGRDFAPPAQAATPREARKSPARGGRDEDTIPGGEHARWPCEPRSKASL